MIDTHAHLNFKAFKNDYPEVIKRSFANGIKKIINIGSNFATSQRAVEIAKEFPDYVKQPGCHATLRCYAAVGLHPIHVQDEEFGFQKHISLIRANEGYIKAIGETGLDYFHNVETEDLQKKVFLKHLELAEEFDLPVILHCRGDQKNPKDAYRDLIEILKKIRGTPPSSRQGGTPAFTKVTAGKSADAQFSNLTSVRRKLAGVIHCFSADWQIAQQFLDLGFLIGFTGVITFDNASPDLLEVVAKTPIEKILIETDCPFLAPQPVRGQRCEPWHVKFTAEKIAKIKNMPLEQVIKITTDNAKGLFQI